MKNTHYQTPQAFLLFTDTSDILTVSTQDVADISSGNFDTVDASKLF